MMWTSAPWWHWLAMASLWVVIVGGAAWVAIRLFPTGPAAPPGARAILDERLARGELDIAEYRRLREELLAPSGRERHG